MIGQDVARARKQCLVCIVAADWSHSLDIDTCLSSLVIPSNDNANTNTNVKSSTLHNNTAVHFCHAQTVHAIPSFLPSFLPSFIYLFIYHARCCPYSSVLSLPPCFPRKRIQEAMEIDRLIDDMYSPGKSGKKTKKKVKGGSKSSDKKGSRKADGKRKKKRGGGNGNGGGANGSNANGQNGAENGDGNPSAKVLSNNIRVFVSSTFRDFGHERDYMMAKTLPILREMCFRKGLTITFVDLRWGVTSEESGRGDVIKLCLDEVEVCFSSVWFRLVWAVVLVCSKCCLVLSLLSSESME